ncbi:hypothetical protein NDU88_003598 [Pleurodeles waltl]|uniref:Uncharacterized protein n=1 Tax=Pleurodeles waltl TaxID=8319 RepID=A0AAV7SGE4_PLEWA|nr:hypothetical protein NDU88_003598 [Pleurodeles waltl]
MPEAGLPRQSCKAPQAVGWAVLGSWRSQRCLPGAAHLYSPPQAARWWPRACAQGSGLRALMPATGRAHCPHAGAGRLLSTGVVLRRPGACELPMEAVLTWWSAGGAGYIAKELRQTNTLPK